MPKLNGNEVIEKTKKRCLPAGFFCPFPQKIPDCYIFKSENKATGEKPATFQ
jgi:hypothetical protein